MADDHVLDEQGAVGDPEVVEIGDGGGNRRQSIDECVIGCRWGTSPRVGTHVARVKLAGIAMVDEVHEWHQAGVFEARKKRGFGSAPVGLVGVRMFHGDEAFAPSAHGDPAHRFVSRMTM